MNITVRTDGIINNTLTEDQFLEIVVQIFGEGKTLDEYIELYNDAPRAKFNGISVHKEVNDGTYAPREFPQPDEDLAAHQLSIDEIAKNSFTSACNPDDPSGFFDATEDIIGEAVIINDE